MIFVLSLWFGCGSVCYLVWFDVLLYCVLSHCISVYFIVLDYFIPRRLSRPSAAIVYKCALGYLIRSPFTLGVRMLSEGSFMTPLVPSNMLLANWWLVGVAGWLGGVLVDGRVGVVEE